MIIPITIPMKVTTSRQVIPMSIGVSYAVVSANEYDGAYEFTPTSETQVIEIENKLAQQNIVINPIPQNYGLITYNGSIITVS